MIAAAMTVFDMSTVQDDLCASLFPDGSLELDLSQRSKILVPATEKVLDKFVNLSCGNAMALNWHLLIMSKPIHL